MATEIQPEAETFGERRVFEEVVEDVLPFLLRDAGPFVLDGEVDGGGRCLVDREPHRPVGGELLRVVEQFVYKII